MRKDETAERFHRKTLALGIASRVYTGAGRYVGHNNCAKMQEEILNLARAFEEFLKEEE